MQEVGKVSQNLSLRLSPDRKYSPKYNTCHTCFYNPCRCCTICHNLPCRCCNLCRCCPCKCNLHCPPFRCCSPCCSPCRFHSPFRAKSPNAPFLKKRNNPNYNSPPRSKQQNNYNSYEEKQFDDFLKKLMDIECRIEATKINLASNPDFNCEDAFRIFECNGRGFLDENDLKCGLSLIGICPTDQEIRLLMKRFDLENQGTINYADFFDMLVPFEKKNRNMVENRIPNSCCPCRCPNVFCPSTICDLRNLFNLILNSENDINNNRKLFGNLRLKIGDILGLLDYLRRGYFTNSDLIVYLQNKRLFSSNKDADLLFIRLDKYRNGKVDYKNVVDELQPIY